MTNDEAARRMIGSDSATSDSTDSEEVCVEISGRFGLMGLAGPPELHVGEGIDLSSALDLRNSGLPVMARSASW